MHSSRRHFAPLLAPLAAAWMAAACGDAPTQATSFAQQAGGRTWVAVAEPAGMPDARTWLPYVAPADARRIRSLVADAAKLRRGGELEAGLVMEAQARLAAAQYLAHDPPPAPMTAALLAVREWETRAGDRLRAGQYPGLDSTLAVVASGRAAAEAALDRGDTRAAAGLLADAGETARGYSPVRVALRLVERAEQRIDADPSPSPDLRRARRLLRTAREAMAMGDETRAMKRAWYAQQIVDAHDAGTADSLR
ncbi:MAG TPA: hypothetical protein VEX86_17865 [Longimicrobium sp.]|nr:hypothetical protein [Longimicrobium sp.]